MTIDVSRSILKVSSMLALVSMTSACDDEPKYEPEYKNLEAFVSKAPIGADADYWIEMKNAFDEWEKVGLIFGYNGDFEECEKAIGGLKSANYAREYRCTPANTKP